MFRCKLYTTHIPHIGLINTLAAPSNFSCQNPGAKVKGEAKKIKILISGRKSARRFSKNESTLHDRTKSDKPEIIVVVRIFSNIGGVQINV